MWVVLTYLPRPMTGSASNQSRHLMTPDSVFGPFDSREEACGWAGSQSFASWAAKCVSPSEDGRRERNWIDRTLICYVVICLSTPIGVALAWLISFPASWLAQFAFKIFHGEL